MKRLLLCTLLVAVGCSDSKPPDAAAHKREEDRGRDIRAGEKAASQPKKGG
jgi:hypothetical protein